jgi:hypothetical protein
LSQLLRKAEIFFFFFLFSVSMQHLSLETNGCCCCCMFLNLTPVRSRVPCLLSLSTFYLTFPYCCLSLTLCLLIIFFIFIPLSPPLLFVQLLLYVCF